MTTSALSRVRIKAAYLDGVFEVRVPTTAVVESLTVETASVEPIPVSV